MKVTILSKEGCGMCDVAEQLVKDLNISYTKEIVDREMLHKKCGNTVSTYPQIFVNGEHIGDNFALEDYIEDNYDPILEENNNRYTVFPIKYHNLWELYK